METRRREKALVVDDNTEALFAVGAIVRAMGFDVDEADGPLAALALFDASRYDLVISDIRMPGDIDGVQLAQILKKKTAGIRIILMTGYDGDLSDGADQFTLLRKPFSLLDIKAALKWRPTSNGETI